MVAVEWNCVTRVSAADSVHVNKCLEKSDCASSKTVPVQATHDMRLQRQLPPRGAQPVTHGRAIRRFASFKRTVCGLMSFLDIDFEKFNSRA